MLKLQKYFLQFHDAIKLGNFDENQTLRDKRDIILRDLREKIIEEVPAFEDFGQGSYAMNTGTTPKDGNYDIDVGLIFDCNSDAYEDPVELKQIVRDALIRNNRTVRIRRSSVTVDYMRNDKVDYHVDLAIYVKRQGEQVLDLAKGKESSKKENRYWEKSDPKGFMELMNSRHSEKDDRAQMRRCIRYLKRWRDNKLISGRPLSIALTCAAYHWFQPQKDLFTAEYADLGAMVSLVETMLSKFDFGGWLTIALPVAPWSDLNGSMTEIQMQRFKEKLEVLRDALIRAKRQDLEEEACKILQEHFDEFPVPEKKETASKAITAGFAVEGRSA